MKAIKKISSILLVGLLVTAACHTAHAAEVSIQKINKNEFFKNQDQTERFISETLELGQREGVIGLEDFYAESYRVIQEKYFKNKNIPAEHALIFARMAWYAIIWANILVTYDKFAPQSQIDDLRESALMAGRLFGWNQNQTLEMFQSTREKFNSYIQQHNQ
jgi:hypothetical protein